MSKAEERACQYTGYCKNQSYSDFLNGYHQAEKDLDVVSWVKEVSGVKDMSHAEEEALKAYPPRTIAANYDTIARRDAFEYGYLKAEKDLELTWEDMRELYIIFAEVDVEIELCKADNIKSETIGYFQEVLKRFKKNN